MIDIVCGVHIGGDKQYSLDTHFSLNPGLYEINIAVLYPVN